jgi:hypothetical protein
VNADSASAAPNKWLRQIASNGEGHPYFRHSLRIGFEPENALLTLLIKWPAGQLQAKDKTRGSDTQRGAVAVDECRCRGQVGLTFG